MKDFQQVIWNPQIEDDCRHLIRLAVREDLDRGFDLTTLGLVPEGVKATAKIVARDDGVLAGLPAAQLALQEMNVCFDWDARFRDGETFRRGELLVRLGGDARDLLTTERLLLNLLGRMCGIATLTRRYVRAVEGTGAEIYDTRKTTPGWRRLEKYAVGCGGGKNHRTGLFDAVLIKDNHLAFAKNAFAKSLEGDTEIDAPRLAVEKAREFLRAGRHPETVVVEIEVDTLEQLDKALGAYPDVVLLDNMTHEQLRKAVGHRDDVSPQTILEASGGVDLTTVRGIAETGVERISVGALTHSAKCLDIGLDWD